MERLLTGPNDWRECQCSCHRERAAGRMSVHATACCGQCPVCKKNIEGNLAKHIQDEHPGAASSSVSSDSILAILGEDNPLTRQPKGGWNYCRCQCHSNPDIRHVMACCAPCPICNRDVQYDMEAHIYDTHPHHDPKTGKPKIPSESSQPPQE